MLKIGVLLGDDIGLEVVPEAVKREAFQAELDPLTEFLIVSELKIVDGAESKVIVEKVFGDWSGTLYVYDKYEPQEPTP